MHKDQLSKRLRQENPRSPVVSGQTVWCSRNLSQKQKFNPQVNQLTAAKPTKNKERKSLLSPCFSALHFQINHQKDFNLYCTSFHLRTCSHQSHPMAATLKASTPSLSQLTQLQLLPCGLRWPSFFPSPWLAPSPCPIRHGVLRPTGSPLRSNTQAPGIPPQCVSYFACQVHTNIQVTKYLAEAT